MNRRDFLQTGAGALALAALAPAALAAEADTAGTAAAPERNLKKGIMWGTVGVKGSVLGKMKAEYFMELSSRLNKAMLIAFGSARVSGTDSSISEAS